MSMYMYNLILFPAVVKRLRMIICQGLQKCQINYLLRILYLVKFYTNTTLFLYLTSL